MKWRHWSILIVLLLLNYLVFSSALTRFSTREPVVLATRTPQPTYAAVSIPAITRVIAPTNTPWSVHPSVALKPTSVTTVVLTPSVPENTAISEPTAIATALSTNTPMPEPTAVLPTAAALAIHVVKRGDTLYAIARRYGVSVSAIVQANGLTNPRRLNVSQKLIIPVPGQALPAATTTVQPATATPQ